MNRRYLNGHPVFARGERVEVFIDEYLDWVPATVDIRYPKAETSGKRSYEYGVTLTDEKGEGGTVHALIDDAHIRFAVFPPPEYKKARPKPKAKKPPRPLRAHRYQ